MSSSNNSNTVLSPIDLNVLPSEAKPIYRLTHKYKLQDAIGLKDQKQRWLSYLDMMRECLYEKNVDFALSYRIQKTLFKKKAPDFPVTAGDWAVKEMLISTIQRKRYYLNKKKNRTLPVQEEAAQEVQEEAAQKVQEEVAQEVQKEVARQEETRRTQEESPVLPLQQESPLEAPQNSQKKKKDVEEVENEKYRY
ncbi:hypothetical protein GLOIN_2v1480211 [Rhizophagus irregularis DAOM 181602=DAOM 197198]|uniref:Uncharacterized protein n=1 Tax=Rhizophagus irregularis (strain DAOM 181602 / DAOM 197198 / MUCL 43194) TaxID=747089 RepID=A0A2P4PUX1_RHIID|nr:hypothetical protein GLOIN_2v1480211 [Rhizophagus irregularis DAOM 181602=DAOM 197198]POG69174.1 hypothetical protein GLOIN_2v1480211 [Rhizophagus irregularis DAOM 181602=DAOM 197198]|eukprot:XP_025176040.1 hypothetical protein GLOIN_2v1480211 [Rhizophagus irregularis DAOM 181602=DAOM 197198]